MTALTQRDAQRQYDSRCDCCHDSEGEWLDSLAADLSDGEIANLVREADLDGSIVEAAIFAWRNNDFGAIGTACKNLVLPLIQQAARDEAERLGEPS